MNSIKLAWHAWSDWRNRPIQGNVFMFSMCVNKSKVVPPSLELYIGLFGFNVRIISMFISKKYDTL